MKSRILIILISMNFFFTSCEKEYMPDCTLGNCVNVNIKGLLYVTPTGEKLNNVLVEVIFAQKGPWLPDVKKVISGKTDKNGIFNFNVTIDTLFFKDYTLCVRIPKLKNYISLVHDPHADVTRLWFYNYDADALQNIRFEFYKKTRLAINFNRALTDDCEYLAVTYFIGRRPIFENTLWIPELVENEELQVWQIEVAADIHTKIEWTKSFKEGVRQFYVDSLICRQNKNNVFTINY